MFNVSFNIFKGTKALMVSYSNKISELQEEKKAKSEFVRVESNSRILSWMCQMMGLWLRGGGKLS